MRGRRVRITVGVIAAVMALGASTAMAAKVFFTATNGKASVFFALKSGDKQKITDFTFDRLKCGDDRVSGGLPENVKVKSDRSFESEQAVVTDEGVSILVKFKGTVARDGLEVRGKLNFSGDCGSKGNFTAVPSAG